jgi:hypothetical protein
MPDFRREEIAHDISFHTDPADYGRRERERERKSGEIKR